MAKQQLPARPWWRRLVRGILWVIGGLLVVGVVAAALRFVYLRQLPTPSYQSPTALADADGNFTEINGMTIYYRERGPATGPAVILIHGFLLETATFEPLLDALAAAGYHVIAFDRPPFGLSDKAAELDYTRQAHADLVVGLLNQLGIERATLLGHSAGAVVAASVALRYSARVDKLVLVDAAFLEYLNAPSAEPRPANPAGGPMMSLIAAGINPVQPWAELEIHSYFTPDRVRAFGRANYGDPTTVPAERIAKLSRFREVTGWEAGFKSFGRQLLSETQLNVADLAELSMPTLIFWGEEDLFIPLITGERLAATIPNAQLLVYPGCGHIPWDGCTSSFVRDLTTFLEGK
jgi:pimeloyl-ACP methyl ester carboxylesterase